MTAVGLDQEHKAHAFYVLAGASGVFFASADEIAVVTGTDPTSQAAIKRHADYLADLIFPA